MKGIFIRHYLLLLKALFLVTTRVSVAFLKMLLNSEMNNKRHTLEILTKEKSCLQQESEVYRVLQSWESHLL